MPIITTPDLPAYTPSVEQEQEAFRIIELRKAGLVAQIKSTVLTCSHCNHQQRVDETTHITNLWYEDAYGCTGGAEYHDIAGRDEFACNHCDKHTRLPPDWNSTKDDSYSVQKKHFAKKVNKFEGKIC
jgi:hypothetical protein